MSSDSEHDDVPLLNPLRVEDARSKLVLKDFFAAFVSILMVGLGITAITLVYAYQTKISDEYSVVLDAGSTHTELMVYKWSKRDVLQGTALIKQIGSCTSTGGSISSYAISDPYKAGASLEGCIKNTAEKLIPAYLQNKSPIYLGATAGMRLVHETDSSASDKIMVSVRQALHKSPFSFEDEHARIITGEEEGLSSWVTVNYLRGGLLYRGIITNSSEEPIDHLRGALDMGGASTQITFPLSKDMKIPLQYTKHLRLYGRTHQLYTHSYLCYGKKEAERRFMASLIKNSSIGVVIDNPCGPKGLLENRTTKFLWQPPCVNAPTSGRPVNNTNVTFQGTANVSECINQVYKLFNFTNCPIDSNCSFDGVYEPSTAHVKFVAFSSYYYAANSLNLTRGGNHDNISLTDFKVAADKVCSESWDQIKAQASNSPSRLQFLKSLCFDAQYVYTLLTRAYHVNNTSTNVAFQNSVHGHSLGWALGFMVNATNLLPTEKPEYRVKAEAFIAVVIVGAILISLGILLSIMATRRVVKRRQLAPRGLIT